MASNYLVFSDVSGTGFAPVFVTKPVSVTKPVTPDT